MNLLDIISLETIRAPLRATEKRQVIEELVTVLAEAGKVKDAAALLEAVWTREQTKTTGIGHGLAIPHGKCPAVDDLAIAVGRPAEPLDFDALDGRPVKLVVLLASPPDRTADHIQALARVSRLMSMEDFRGKLYEAATPEEIYEILESQHAAG